MFEQLTERLSQFAAKLTDRGRLTEKDIEGSLRTLRRILVEADVALEVSRDLIKQLRQELAGPELRHSVAPGKWFMQRVESMLQQTMGSKAQFDLRPNPLVILLAGLQGSGKTTTTIKLARWLREQGKKRILVASCDVYRPAAMEQLARLAAAEEIDCLASPSNSSALAIATAAQAAMRAQKQEVLIIDSAGRNNLDDSMMEEIKNLQGLLKPQQTLLVVDSLTGQDSADIARSFGNSLNLDGLVLTKIDGDSRGGAALSLRVLTGKPIKFLGSGEKSADLALFEPEKITSRLLGKGDIGGLIKQLGAFDKKAADQEKSKKKKKRLTLLDLRQQLTTLQKAGGIASIMDKLPSNMQAAGKAIDSKQVMRMIAIIDSMTAQERLFPQRIKGSHKRRIANGSGTEVQHINQLLKQYEQAAKMMKRAARGGGLPTAFGGGPGSPFSR